MNRRDTLPPHARTLPHAPPDATPASPWLPLALAAIVVCGYSLTLAKNHTEGEDSGHYIEVVRNTDLAELFYPNHVLFASFNSAVYKAWQAAGYRGDAAMPMQLNNVLAAAATLLLLFYTARRLRLGDFHAALCVALTAVCYGFWWYGVEAETYLLPLPFILLCVLVLVNLAERPFALRRFLALGCCFSLAVLFHQQHVLLMPILLAAICVVWYCRRGAIPPRSLLLGLAVFGAVAAVLIGGVYLAVAFSVHGCSSLAEAVHWSKGTAQGGLWTPWSWANPVKSLMGAGRAICGLHFLYGFDFFHNAIARVLPEKFLADDRFLAESISPPLRWLCLATAAVAGISAVAVAVACLLPLGPKTELSSQTRIARWAFAVFALGAIAAYAVFNTLWEPQNIEFWVMLIPLAALAVTLRLSRRRMPRWPTAATLTLIASLFLANLLGSILPQTRRAGDYWYAANDYLIERAEPGDLVVTDGGWISDNCLRSNTPAAVLVVRETPAAKLPELIDRHRGGRIFISSWALRPEPAIVATSPDWQRDEQQLRRIFEPMRQRLRKLDDNGYQVIWELPVH